MPWAKMENRRKKEGSWASLGWRGPRAGEGARHSWHTCSSGCPFHALLLPLGSLGPSGNSISRVPEILARPLLQ